MEFLVWFILLALLAEVLGTVGGFGSSLFFVPVAGLFFDFYSVLGITALFHLSSNLSKIVLFRKGFDLKLVLNIGIPAVLFVIAGAALSRFVTGNLLELMLGVFLVTLSAVFLLAKDLVIPATRGNSWLGGALSGFAAGLLGTGGAIRGLTLAAFALSKDVFIATSALIDMGVDLSRSVVYFANGFMHRHDLYLIPILLGVSILGTFIGKKLLEYISRERFRRIVLLFILFTGCLTIAKLWIH